ncbi:E3 ubiquitin-protein ligase [Tasmannia lanceolata]|uniref:E3 ubiquitin-protein ligase n=1 Tax=Tasmannia lanceolata TaxID=3420 RepID=UPI004064212F
MEKVKNESENENESLSEADRRALRGSRFAPLPSPSLPTCTRTRLAHPGGPLATNKAAALAKFLERKLNEPGGLNNINPALLERAVKNAKDTLKASGSGTSSSGRIVRHVTSFGDYPEDSDQDKGENQDKAEGSKQKKNKKKKAKRKKEALIAESPKNKKHKKKFKS